MYICIHTYIHSYIHTYIYIYIRIHTKVQTLTLKDHRRDMMRIFAEAENSKMGAGGGGGGGRSGGAAVEAELDVRAEADMKRCLLY